MAGVLLIYPGAFAEGALLDQQQERTTMDYEFFHQGRSYRPGGGGRQTTETEVDYRNRKRTATELGRWMNDKPAEYFAYVNETTKRLTTWTGANLGSIQFGDRWHDNFGGERQTIRVHGTNGVTYYGTYYRSAGDYARIRAYTDQDKLRDQP